MKTSQNGPFGVLWDLDGVLVDTGEIHIDELGLRMYFTAFVSAYHLSGKPDPGVFIEAARQIGLPSSRCIVVEDSIADLQAARRAGCRCIAVTTTNPPQALENADVIVNTLDELPANAFESLMSGPHA